MLLEEFDAEKYERTIRDEGREEGLKEGRAEGREEGRNLVNRLGLLLTEAGRSDEFLKSLSDQEFQKKLLAELGLKEEQS